MMTWNCRNKHLLPLVAAAAALLAAYAISGQSSPAGFINIDCGKAKGYIYTDPHTSLNYTSDFEYIDTGEIHKISNSDVGLAPNKQALDLRSFPNGTRNCYTIKSGVENGGKYLVRASFMYGNYDGKGTTPKFDLYLGVNFWTSIASEKVSTNYMEEMITVPTSDEVSVCLINTGFGTPFISALELRPLPSDLYDRCLTSEDTFKDLKLYTRKNFQGNYTRYPQDRYDRSWFSELDDDFKTLTSTSTVDSTTNTYDPPSDVMKKAIYKSSSSLSLSWAPSGFDLLQRSGFLVILHFAELQELKVNETRIFNVIVGNDAIVAKRFSPAYLVTTSLCKSDPSTIQKISLRRTNESTLPPIINAAEVLLVRNETETETSDDDVHAATAIKVKYKVKRNWVGDPCSPAKFKWVGLNCSTQGFTNFKIVSINLSSSGLTGEISTSFANLSELQYLDLSRNGLTGDVPDILGNLIHLKVLNLSGNKLSGDIPKALLDRSDAGKLTLDYDQPGDNKKKLPTIAVIFIVIVSSAMIILFLLFCFKKEIKKKNLFFWRKRRRPGNDPKCESIPPNPSPPMPPFQQGSKQLTSGELEKITSNFREEIGRGGFGPVYYGELDNAKVAVKILSNTSTQGLREFQAEASLLTTIHHRNLVSLLGYCNEENSLSLIYEYMEKGNLRDHLTGEAGSTLNWEKRLQISVEAAQGLEYLHVGCKPAIVHRDVKTGNILLNNKLQAKFSDFGLSKLFQDDFYTHISTRPAGTIGYMDPEYFTTGMLNEKVDVYSFGVVLLELVTGLPALLKNPENINLSYWVRTRVQEGKLDEIIDRRICGECDINSVGKVVETALACTSPEPLQRPTMTQVLMLLKECLEMVAADANNKYSTQE